MLWELRFGAYIYGAVNRICTYRLSSGGFTPWHRDVITVSDAWWRNIRATNTEAEYLKLDGLLQWHCGVDSLGDFAHAAVLDNRTCNAIYPHSPTSSLRGLWYSKSKTLTVYFDVLGDRDKRESAVENVFAPAVL